jgi:hypothetical protein
MERVDEQRTSAAGEPAAGAGAARRADGDDPAAGPAPLAGSDAERRAARAFAERLRAGGRAVEVETVWVRPRWELAHALHAGLGVAASLVAVSSPPGGLALALIALLSLLLDLSGRAFLLRRLTPERATQNVVAAGANAPELQVILTASADAPRGGLLGRMGGGGRSRGGGARRWLPSPFACVALALLAVAGCAGARLAGAEGTAIGAIQLVPTIALLAAVGLLVDAALARPADADAVAPEVLLAATQALDATPPRHLSVSAVLAGAGSGQALGFRAHLRRRRPEPERTVVIEIAAGSAAPGAAWWTHDGPLLPLRYHPQLVALARDAAAEEPRLGARARRGRAVGAALRARQRRIPAIRLGAPAAADALALVLALVELLDETRVPAHPTA